MPKKEWTDEQRAAFGEKMRKARLDKQTHSSYPTEEKKNPEPVQANSDNADMAELLARMAEMQREMNLLKQQPAAQENVAVNRGKLTGTFEKYITDPTYYPSPNERLAHEPRLQRFAFRDNFELDFGTTKSFYETKDGINTTEPRFTLKLIRIVYDDDTGEPTNQRYVVSQLIFHEDPQTALTIAQDNEIPVETWGEKEFLDEMRYLRMRDWLIECFYPPAPAPVSDRRETVIGNRLVEVFTVNTMESAPAPSIPFSTMSKLK